MLQFGCKSSFFDAKKQGIFAAIVLTFNFNFQFFINIFILMFEFRTRFLQLFYLITCHYAKVNLNKFYFSENCNKK